MSEKIEIGEFKEYSLNIKYDVENAPMKIVEFIYGDEKYIYLLQEPCQFLWDY